MKKYTFIFPLLVAAVLVSGCATTPYDGSPPKVDQARIDAVTASATAWIASTQGRDMFPVGSLALPIPVFDSNRTVEHWVLPVKDDQGMYLGFFVSKNDSFTTPLSATAYPDPRHNLFSKAKEEAYNLMLKNSVYTADQIKEPWLCTIAGKGYHWASDVVVDGRHVERLVLPVSIIDPSPADDKSGGKAGISSESAISI